MPEFGLEDIPCKIDTGAYTSSLHCSRVHILEKDGISYLCFKLYDPAFGINNKKEFRFSEYREKRIRSSNGLVDYRYSIKTSVVIYGHTYKTDFTLSFREKMRYPILLGKRLLKRGFLVDVNEDDLSFNAKRDIK